jgi:hypothetical protein
MYFRLLSFLLCCPARYLDSHPMKYLYKFKQLTLFEYVIFRQGVPFVF